MELELDVLLSWKAAAVGAWLALFFVAERLIPRSVEPDGARNRLGRNGGLWLSNLVLSPLVVVPVSVLAKPRHNSPGRGIGYSGTDPPTSRASLVL